MTLHARAIRLSATIMLASSVAACATVVRGSKTAWDVQTSPAGASVVTSTGRSCDSTPCVIRMPRKSRFTATITKAGYKPASVNVGHEMSTPGLVGLAGNLVLGGIVGVGVDFVSGATLDLTPNPSVVVLEREPDPSVLLPYVPPAALPTAVAVLAAPAGVVPPPPAPTWTATAPPPRDGASLTLVRVATEQGAATFETYGQP